MTSTCPIIERIARDDSIMRLAWLTDLHLDFVGSGTLRRLAGDIAAAVPDAVLIGGDTGQAGSFAGYLDALAAEVACPVYFVLGNHDYYHGSIAGVREEAARLSRTSERLRWLPDVGVVPLTESTALVGHGGWGDVRAGDFNNSDVVLNDYLLIEELRASHRAPIPLAEHVLVPALREKLHALGDDAADHFRQVLPEALEQFRQLLVLMHVPPFREACWHQGRISDDNWLPHFTCLAAGEVLRDLMDQHPDRHMTVLCGHTHSTSRIKILPNLEVITGEAEYGQPAIQEILTVP
jgi:3',5'-cyclic-AMP phosphodiesterase